MNLKARMVGLLLLVSGLILAACGGQPVVVPTQAAVAVLATAVATPDSAVEATPLAIEPAAAEVGERPLLPRFSSAAASGAPDPASPFAATTFNLSVSLPDQPASAPVFRAQPAPFDQDYARRLAEQFGFAGPLYTQILPENVSLEASYYAFDGPRSFNVNEFSATYTDSSVTLDYNDLPDFSQTRPAAEAFLQARGLLNFPYELQPGWSGEVAVVRLIDGRPASQPEISVGVASDGQVAYVSFQALTTSDLLADYPLVTAPTAWERLSSGLADSLARGEIFLTVAQPTAVTPAQANPASFQYWPRVRQSAPDAHLYAWPAAYALAEGDGPPRVQVLSYELQADAATLSAIAAAVGQNVHVWGTLDTVANTLALAGWEAIPDLQPTMKSGVLQVVDGQLQLVEESTGETFILPDTPADLPLDGVVNVFAWGVRDTGLAFPVLDWEGIDRQVGETAVFDSALTSSVAPILADRYTGITIEQVSLAYVYSPIYDSSAGAPQPLQPDVLWHPAWLFTGTADNGDRLSFYVPAVDPAYVQP